MLKNDLGCKALAEFDTSYERMLNEIQLVSEKYYEIYEIRYER